MEDGNKLNLFLLSAPHLKPGPLAQQSSQEDGLNRLLSLSGVDKIWRHMHHLSWSFLKRYWLLTIDAPYASTMYPVLARATCQSIHQWKNPTFVHMQVLITGEHSFCPSEPRCPFHLEFLCVTGILQSNMQVQPCHHKWNIVAIVAF